MYFYRNKGFKLFLNTIDSVMIKVLIAGDTRTTSTEAVRIHISLISLTVSNYGKQIMLCPYYICAQKKAFIKEIIETPLKPDMKTSVAMSDQI